MACTRISHMENVSTFLNNDPFICPESHEESLMEKGFGDMQETREHVVLLANKHVTAARAQKGLLRLKLTKPMNLLVPLLKIKLPHWN